jgi:thiol-disulfide isomerase/thioredoxin
MPQSLATPQKVTIRKLNKLHDMIQSKTTILLLHAQWCFHCKMFRPVWERIVKRAHDTDITKHVQFLEIEENVLSILQRRNNELFKYVSTTTKSNQIFFPKLMVFVKKGDKVMKTTYDETRSREENAVFKFIMNKVPKEERANVRRNVALLQQGGAPKKSAKSAKSAKSTTKTKAEKEAETQTPVKKSRKPSASGTIRVKRNKLYNEEMVDYVKAQLGETNSMSLQGIINHMMNKYSIRQ